MRLAAKTYFLSTLVVLLSSFSNFRSCFSLKLLNYSLDVFQPAVATWYGSPNGAGSGGACGFENDVSRPPFSARISAGNQALFQRGKGCGTCYQVRCTQNPACSGSPLTVTITDECPGTCNNDRIHFDLSGTAFGALAKPGQADQLRKAGRIGVQFQRVACNYRGTPIVFKVDKGSNPNWFAAAIEYQNGDGNLALVQIQPAGSSQWFPMQQTFGATYKYDVPKTARGPFSISLTAVESRSSVVARNVIPANWKPGQYYRSNVNFRSVL